ncbi:MAG TPA: sortase [Candidatus Limnocylindrales bacterium]|nr:sortase [Candidatus Limnocylindrales bacterium]
MATWIRRFVLHPIPAILIAAALALACMATSAVGSAVTGTASTAAAYEPIGTFRYPAANGMKRTVYRFGCRGGTLPNKVMKWSCAGHGNMYLLGHAWGVFDPLHDAYRDGKLRRGQIAYWTREGVTRRYKVAWIRVVPKTFIYRGMAGSQWAWNATNTPAITLQTCWGRTSAYRIIVRLYRV